MYKVSIIVPTYNRKDSVKRLLIALDNQSFPSNEFEVIVSIDGSMDGTREMIEELETSYHKNCLWEKNSGRAKACNRGIAKARGEVVIILDDDMEPLEQFVRAHYILHEDNDRIAVIGSAPIVINESSTPIVRYIAGKFNSHLNKISNPGYLIQIRDFYSGNFSISKELLTEIGLYNETFEQYGNEDVELAHRFLSNQVAIVFSSEAKARQHYEKDLEGVVKDNISKGNTVVQLVKIHPGLFTELKLCEYNLSSLKWRSLRAFLIRTTLIIGGTKHILVLILNILGRLFPSKTENLYRLALDYFFWLGVWMSIGTDDNKELKSRITAYGLT